MLGCLVAHIGITSNGCSQESIRAVHTGLQFYQPVRAAVYCSIQRSFPTWFVLACLGSTCLTVPGRCRLSARRGFLADCLWGPSVRCSVAHLQPLQDVLVPSPLSAVLSSWRQGLLVVCTCEGVVKDAEKKLEFQCFIRATVHRAGPAGGVDVRQGCGEVVRQGRGEQVRVSVFYQGRFSRVQGLPVVRTCDKDVEKFCVKDAEKKAKEWAAGKGPGGVGKFGILGRAAADASVGQVNFSVCTPCP